ncbi:MAG: hypothetical protein ACJA08_002913 [Cyclobacteriaceae bacterium]|jgi:hypothetical protein
MKLEKSLWLKKKAGEISLGLLCIDQWMVRSYFLTTTLSTLIFTELFTISTKKEKPPAT